MKKISIFEFTEKIERKEHKSYSGNYNINMFGYISKYGYGVNSYLASNATSVNSSNITDSILNGVLNTKKRFAILFLYDYMHDKLAESIMTQLGGYIHNLTSSNISFITYFNDDMIKNWSNIIDKDEINKQESDYEEVETVINLLMDEFDIKNRSLVIYECTGDKKSYTLDVSNLDVSEFKSLLVQINNIICENLNQNLKTIVWELQGASNKIKRNEVSLADFFDKVKKSNKVMNNMNREDIAFVLDLSVRTVYNKIYNVNGNSFTREECIKCITTFNPKIELLDEMFKVCNLRPLGFDGQDKIIRNVYRNGFSSDNPFDRIDELNHYLEKAGYNDLDIKN